MADGIASGGAGVGDDRDGAAETQGVQNHSRLDLGLVVDGARGLPAMSARCSHRLAKIGFSEFHAARCRAQHERQILRRLPACLLPCLMRRQQQHRPGPVQAGNLARAEGIWRQRGRQIDLRRHLCPLAADIEKRHRPERGAARAKSAGVWLPPDAQGCDNARSGDDHPWRCGSRR